jgi:pimeloyl-ACP methyl ester carboxylesterase
LVEPVMLPPPKALLQRLSDGARHRRTRWSSRNAARQYFSTLSFFAVWEPRALDLYVQEGLAQQADGSVVLKCPPEVEATIFAASGGLDLPCTATALDCAVSILWAKRSPFFPRSCYEALVRAMPRGRLLEVDAGHLVPMEHPDLIVQAAQEIRNRVLK